MSADPTQEPHVAAQQPIQSAAGKIQPNAEHHYTVTRKNLPLSCPMPEMSLWNSHQRVFLPIEASGEAMCPYCGARYTLSE
ncbi:MAG TPA: zinc-finger domain-containing protein [Gammaproteobacteria bacterium]|nr:zinc-finger domain-containing protein [Gammaproteobacteria bacterium]